MDKDFKKILDKTEEEGESENGEIEEKAEEVSQGNTTQEQERNQTRIEEVAADVERQAVDQPPDDRVIVNEPAVEQPVAEEPIVNEQIVEDPGVNDPAVNEPIENDQIVGLPFGAGGNGPQGAQPNPAPDANVVNNGVDAGVANPLNENQPGWGGRIGNFFHELAIPGIAALGNFWNNRVLPSSKTKEKKYENGDHPFIKKIKDLAFANNSDSDEYLLILGNIYTEGNSQYGIKSDVDKASEYYEMASELGNMEATVYIGTYYLNRNNIKALKYLKR